MRHLITHFGWIIAQCTRDNMGKEGFYLVAYGLVPLVKELGFYSADNGKSSMGNQVTRTEYLHFLMPEKK